MANTFPELSEQALEDILVAIANATDSRGLKINLLPEHVLVPEVLMQRAMKIVMGNESARFRQSLRDASAEPIYVLINVHNPANIDMEF
jgi:hypothetical protein